MVVVQLWDHNRAHYKYVLITILFFGPFTTGVNVLSSGVNSHHDVFGRKAEGMDGWDV